MADRLNMEKAVDRTMEASLLMLCCAVGKEEKANKSSGFKAHLESLACGLVDLCGPRKVSQAARLHPPTKRLLADCSSADDTICAVRCTYGVLTWTEAAVCSSLDFRGQASLVLAR